MTSRNLPDLSTVSEWINATDLQAKADRLAAAFRPVSIATRRAAAAIEPLARLITEAERGPAIGRKRRARRARGRRIEARQALGHGHWFRVQLDPSRPSLLELARKIHVPVDEVDSFFDPSFGEPWEEQGDV
jgi:hypothetical protein